MYLNYENILRRYVNILRATVQTEQKHLSGFDTISQGGQRTFDRKWAQ